MPNFTNFVHHETIDESAYVEILVVNACKYITVRQLGSETQVAFGCRYRAAAAGDPDYVAAGDVLAKGISQASAIGGSNVFRPGDTIGFFQRLTGSGNMILVVVEHEL